MLPTNRLGLGRVRRFGPSPAARATFRYASLRVRRGVHSKNRVRKVQGGDQTEKTYPAAISASAASSVKNLATYHVGLLRERFCRLG